jgi:hypothetical protein
MRQLEQWNADTFGYSAPSASQYLENERQLASLDRVPRARGANEVAPVLMAMVSPVAVHDAPTASPVAKPAEKKIVLAQAAPPEVRSDAEPRMTPTRRREQLRMIEDQLLAESTLADLKRAAAREAAGGKSGQ